MKQLDYRNQDISPTDIWTPERVMTLSLKVGATNTSAVIDWAMTNMGC
jgi:hypothetical protein